MCYYTIPRDADGTNLKLSWQDALDYCMEQASPCSKITQVTLANPDPAIVEDLTQFLSSSPNREPNLEDAAGSPRWVNGQIEENFLESDGVATFPDTHWMRPFASEMDAWYNGGSNWYPGEPKVVTKNDGVRASRTYCLQLGLS